MARRREVVNCKQLHNVIVSWHPFIFFYCIRSSRPCLGYKCTLSCGTIVLLYAAELSGTTSSSELWPDVGLYVCIVCFCFLKCAQLFAKCRQVQPFAAQKQIITQKQEMNHGSTLQYRCMKLFKIRVRLKELDSSKHLVKLSMLTRKWKRKEPPS